MARFGGWQMTSYLGVVLETAMKSPGVVAGALIDSQGCVVENACWVDGDPAVSGAVASQMLRRWASVGTDLGIGTVQSILIERPGGPVTITPVGQNVALVVGNHACPPGRLRLQARRAREAMGNVDRMVPAPEVSAPSLLPEHLDDLVVTSEPAPPPRLTTGEVVLIGTHTFRLVTNLIAQLLQLKGVQSSRLRAYSPSSTIVDVVLEDGATLGAIDSSRLEEFSIERTEAGGTRLVLRACRSLAIPPTPIGSPG